MIMRHFCNTGLNTNMKLTEKVFGVNTGFQGDTMQSRKVWVDFVHRRFSLMAISACLSRHRYDLTDFQTCIFLSFVSVLLLVRPEGELIEGNKLAKTNKKWILQRKL